MLDCRLASMPDAMTGRTKFLNALLVIYFLYIILAARSNNYIIYVVLIQYYDLF